MSGQKIVYKRVSSQDQNPERQLDGMAFDKLFIEYASGKDCQRPKLQELLSYVRQGDEVYVDSLDRMARNLSGLKKIVHTILEKGASISFKKENLLFTPDKESSALSTFLLHVMGAFAELERSLIKERQAEGIALAKARGVYKGRSKCLSDEQVVKLKEKAADGVTISRLARQFGITRPTVYRYLK